MSMSLSPIVSSSPVPIQSQNDIKSEQKLLFICESVMSEDDVQAIGKVVYMTTIDQKELSMTGPEVFQRIQCLLLDLNDSDQRRWYQDQMSSLKALPNLRIIYVASKGKKCNIDNAKKIYGASIVMKYIPVADTLVSFLAKLTDHIPNVERTILEKLMFAISSMCSK